jgi:flagellar assembly protein FliH
MPLTLETFDDDESAAQTQNNSYDYQLGYAAGEAAAIAARAAEQGSLRNEVVQSIADINFGFDEAHHHILAQLGPLFNAMLTQILPATLSSGLVAALQDIAIAAAQQDADHPIVLRLPPDQLEAVQAALTDAAHPHMTFVADPTLNTHAAIAQTASTETALDLDTALSEISGVFDALPETKKRSS